jgi:hypothetical protein
MYSWRWMWRCIRVLLYLVLMALLILGEKSTSPVIRGCLAGFLIADILTDILFCLITLPTLDGREAVEASIKTFVTLVVVHYWGFKIPPEADALGPGFIVSILTAAIKMFGFFIRIFPGIYDPEES